MVKKLKELAIQKVMDITRQSTLRTRHLVRDLEDLGIRQHLVKDIALIIKRKIGKRKDKFIKIRHIMVSINTREPVNCRFNIVLFTRRGRRGVPLSDVTAVASIKKSIGQMCVSCPDKGLVAELALKMFE